MAEDSTGYKVGSPPKRKITRRVNDKLKEIFFPDDPLRPFRGQPASRKFILAIQYVFPIFEWARKYDLRKLRGDVISGLTIASLAIPQDIGYAKLAGVDPKYGLYGSFVAPLIYAAMGSSSEIAIGPVAVVSLFLGTQLQNELSIKDPNYTRLAFTSTFFAGMTMFILGFFRLGFIIDYLSHAAIIGFMAGAAITIGLQQLKGFLGIANFTTKTDIIHVMRSVWSPVKHGWNWQTIVIASVTLIILLTAKYISKKNKKLFWVSALAPLMTVIFGTLIVYLTHAYKHGVNIVKHIDKGLPPASDQEIFWTGNFVTKGLRIGALTALVALTEASAIGRTFANLKDYYLDGNKEMLALGTMNIVGSLTSCYVTTGSFSRSAVNFEAGCQTAVSNIVMAFVLMLTLLVVTPLFKYTPNAVIASIIISAVSGLVDIKAMIKLWKVDKLDFIACMGAFIGVVFVSVEIGLLIAVGLSMAKILLEVTRPRIAVLGNVPRTRIFRNVEQYPEAIKVSGLMVLRVDSAIYFANANYVRERILRWLREEDEQLRENQQPDIKFLILELSPVVDIDTSGIHALDDLYKTLNKREIQFALANPGVAVYEKLYASGFVEEMGEDKIFLTVGDAVAAYGPKANV